MEDTQKVNLIAFLTARLDEDEATAKAAIQWGDGVWTQGVSEFDSKTIRENDPSVGAGDMFIDRHITDLEHARHIARHDPARVLQELQAKRFIIREHEIRDGRCRVCTAIHDGRATRFRAPCPTLVSLAAIYSDHSDYDQEWAP